MSLRFWNETSSGVVMQFHKARMMMNRSHLRRRGLSWLIRKNLQQFLLFTELALLKSFLYCMLSNILDLLFSAKSIFMDRYFLSSSWDRLNFSPLLIGLISDINLWAFLICVVCCICMLNCFWFLMLSGSCLISLWITLDTWDLETGSGGLKCDDGLLVKLSCVKP